MGRFHHQEPRFRARRRGYPYARRILDLRLGDRAHADRCRLHAGSGRLSRTAARHLSASQTEAGPGELEKNETGRCLHRRPGGGDPGLAFAASRIRPAEDRVRPAMSHSLLFAFVIFATVMFFTPGPNNIMLLS